MDSAKAILDYLNSQLNPKTNGQEEDQPLPSNTELQALMNSEMIRSPIAKQGPANTQADIILILKLIASAIQEPTSQGMTGEHDRRRTKHNSVAKPVQEPVDAQFQDSLVSEVHGNRLSAGSMDPSTMEMIHTFQEKIFRPVSQPHQHMMDSFRHINADGTTISRVRGDQYDISKRAPKASTPTPQINPLVDSNSRLRRYNNCIIKETDGSQVTYHN